MQKKYLLEKAIKKWGKNAQVLMAVEEMSELTHELLADLRGREHNILEEMADVEIMLEQLKIIYCNPSKLKFMIDSKMCRLQKNIDAYSEDNIKKLKEREKESKKQK